MNWPDIAARVTMRPLATEAAVRRSETVPVGATMRDAFALLLNRFLAMKEV
ncbi:hypothetical protein [Rathayibacter rathayi]|uniref:hypothetical protein n=1 Tax=Rathayibacter rathayi TaxID=33887 RepID=UPI0015E252D7|nr:hypothetical protein [Rathayibacter rathayi]